MDFSNDEFGEVRTLVEGEKIWFNLNDICRALDLKNPRKVMTDLPKDVTNSYTLLTNDYLFKSQTVSYNSVHTIDGIPKKRSICLRKNYV